MFLEVVIETCMAIPNHFIQELLNRTDIVDLIERHVPLKKGGANYSACCPFHSEKSPSFTVSPSKQFYHCFGCGAHGTALGFLMEYSGLGFVDAVKELAHSVGMAVPEERSPQAHAQRSRSEGENGEDLPVGIDLYGPSSKQYRNAIQSLQSRALRRQAKKEKATPQQMEEEAINLLVAVSAGARNLGINASGLVPKTADDFRELYSEPKFMWIKDQVDEGLGDKGNFLTP